MVIGVWYGRENMLEKRFIAVPAQDFIADGTTDGIVTVNDTRLFKVKQEVIISASSLPNLDAIEVKRINNLNEMVVGPRGANINAVSDVSDYITTLNAAIFANEQKRPSIPFEETTRAVYEEEPTVAVRSMLVDKEGNDYRTSNPFPVQLTDGSLNIGTVVADLSVQLSHLDNFPTPGKIADSVRVGNGVNILHVNADGSVNINTVSSPSALSGLDITHDEISAVASGIETPIITIVASGSGMKVYRIDVSGENIALFRVKVNTVTISNKRTFFGGDLNESFIFEPFENGLELFSGDTLVVTVLHQRPFVANFEASIMSFNL